MSSGSGKLLDLNDAIFDLTELLKTINTQIAGAGLKVDTELSISGNVIVQAVRVASDDAGVTLRYIKTAADGTVQVAGTVSVTGVATEITLSAINGKLPATLGQKTMAASLAVAIASDQSAVPVSGTVSVTGVATEVTLGLVKAKTDNLDVLLSTRATEATLASRLADATFTGRIGEVQAIPTANTVLARLKDLLTGIVLAAGANNIGSVNLGAAIPAGANTIGGVNIASAIPAGANRIGKITIRNSVDTADIDPPSSAQLPAALTAGGNLKTALLEAIPAGANNIGSINLGAAIPAGTNRIGGAYAVSGQIIDENGAVLTVKRAFANIAASITDGSVIAAVATKKLRILAVYAQCGATATNLTFNSKPAGAGAAISPTMQNGANGGEVLPQNSYGWFETVAGEGLTVTTGTGSQTGVHVLYLEV